MYDRRGSSLLSEIDAAIERVVSHFEENDVALRLDVLRGLTVQAKLAFECERMRERLQQHPATRELISQVTTQSSIYERLVNGMVVEEFDNHYDPKHNTRTHATLRWNLLNKANSSSSTKSSNKSKRQRVTNGCLWTQHTFTRTLHEENGKLESPAETVVTFKLNIAIGANGSAQFRELVRFEMGSEVSYPRSFYEDDHNEDASVVDESEPVAEMEPEGADSDSVLHLSEEDSDDGATMDKDVYGEYIRDFNFDENVLDELCGFLDVDHEQLDPVDIISFLLTVPICEDDWSIDERICSILFGPGASVQGDEMDEVEVVSDFDEEPTTTAELD